MPSRLAREFNVVLEWWAPSSLGQDGLGLAIVRELVLLHHGQIDVTNELNQGASFTVSLPVKPETGIASAGVSRHHPVASDQALELAGEGA